ncbi:putative solute carrier family 35 member F5 [Apostichopus japonicus]|uniref:Solute carrier family 35 member F5 n=1 Tax=Stichopus japonicus TaxID=307972 RepID=A0A2G8JXK0_STIJA|nr:putative solute carrier family 35 member F5 [Apostichopus japonicus]
MSLTSGLPPHRRLFLGFCLLLIVVIIWVISGELTTSIFKDFNYVNNKPFFATYFETSLFMLYLVGFVFWKPWRRQCLDCFNRPKSLPFSLSDSSDDEEAPDIPPTEPLLSDPLYVPVKFDESDKEDYMETENPDSQVHVRFSNLMEVRHLADCQADEAMLARMSYQATQAAKVSIIESYKWTVTDVAKISFMFCMVWFLANFSYHKAMNDKNPVVMTTASSTSSLFTLLLAGVFPSSPGDKFTLTKLVSVLACIAGVFLVVFSKEPELGDYQLGAAWGMSSSIFYAIYLVMLRRKVDNEDKLDIPMFFGPVAVVSFIKLILVFKHFMSRSKILGWGCFLTSSLIGTLSLSLTIPLTVLVEIYYSDMSYNLLFFIGCAPVVVSFLLVSLLHYYDDWDPVWVAFALLLRIIKHITCCLWRGKWKHRTPEDPEQTERLISLHNLTDTREGEQECC